MRIVMLGPPGAGKGTQAGELSGILGVLHISTGDMFRQAVSDQTPMGIEAKRYMDSGALVPDEVTIGIVKERLGKPDCAKGFILDGFPRTEAQAVALQEILAERQEKLDRAICIVAESDLLISRLTGRRTCRNCAALYHIKFSPPRVEGVCDKCGGPLFQRDDDKEETVRRRLEVYHEQTAPLISFYREKQLLADIDGDLDKEQVTGNILKELHDSGV